jgi:uncharacterized Tic20 family protein
MTDATLNQEPSPTPPPLPLLSWERNWALWTHLGAVSAIIGLPVLLSLILWAHKKSESPFVEHHGREAVNFQLSIVTYLLIANITMWVLGWLMCGLPWVLMPVISFIVIAFAVIQAVRGAIHASGEKMFMYPVTIRFVK